MGEGGNNFNPCLNCEIDSQNSIVIFLVVVGQDSEKPSADGRKADALLAAHYASEAALRLVKPGNEVSIYYYLATLL